MDDWITYFAKTDSRNKQTPFGIKQSDRSRHSYVIGKTGMGKSTLLENMAVQDIQNGQGLTFIDPHGSTAEKLLDYVPEERIKDVLYFAPFDLSYPISFNVMENVEADKRHLVVNGLMSTFEKIWVDAWSARMAYILQNTLLALLEYPEATLLDVNYMYTHSAFRKKVVACVTDPTVRSFWEQEYESYTDRYVQEATPAIQNKIGQFASSSLVRNVIGQPQSSFNIRDLMDQNKIFIVNLSKGRVGEGNANLLGSMLITKIYLAAMSRADTTSAQMNKLPPHYLYVDEFQSFANRSFADILSEARKYKLALTIAHQYIEQMEEEVRAAVFGNVGTMITFRVGAYDAEVLEKEFAPTFTIQDIVNLGARQIYLKLMIDGVSSQPFSATTLPPIDEPSISHRDRAIAYSRRTFARPRIEVESEIQTLITERDATQDTAKKPGGGKQGGKNVPKQDDRAPRDKMLALVKEREGKTEQSDDKQKDSALGKALKDVVPKSEPEKRNDSLRDVLSTISAREQAKEEKKTKKDVPNEKSATQEDRNQLKEVLASVLPKQTNSERPQQNSSEQDKHRNRSKNDRAKKKQRPQVDEEFIPEVPEKVLRSLLDVSDEAKKT